MNSDPTIVPSNDLDWAAAFYRDLDTMQIDKLGAWFADNIEMRFANNPPITDKVNALDVMSQFYASVGAMRHERVNLLEDGDTLVQQVLVNYTRADGSEIALPASSYLRRNSAGLLDRLWIYTDVTPLYALPITPGSA